MALKFLFALLMLYGLIFLALYLLIVATAKSDAKYSIKAQVLAVVTGWLLIFGIPAIRMAMGWPEMPEGKYMIMAFMSYFYGPWVMAALVLGMTADAYWFYGPLAYGTGIMSFMVGGLFLGFRRYFDLSGKVVRARHLMIAACMPSLVTIPMSNLMFGHLKSVNTSTANAPLILVATLLLSFAIFYAVNREISQKHMIRELHKDKLEIQALYEEMAAAEETLRENYDELSRYKDRIEYLAYHSPVTGCYNKDYLLQRLSQDTRGVLLLVSIVDLENYAKSLGETLMSRLHTYIAEVLKQKVGESHEEILYDLGTCKFACLFKQANDQEEAIKQLTLDITRRLRAVQLVDKFGITVKPAFGGVLLGESIDETLWLTYAEAALHASEKSENHELKWFSSNMYEAKLYTNRLELDLNHAVRSGELYMVYQPQYDRNRKLIGAEALIRWQHHELGAIQPSVFIPMAERLGLIDAIGLQVVQLASDFQMRHLKRRVPQTQLLPIAINVSLLELISPAFTDHVGTQLARRSVSADLIGIEITESALASHVDQVSKNLTALGHKGHHIYLDDFGTGYSSLAYLSQFPIQTVKLDKSFIDRFLISEKDRHVISGIIELAHRIDMKVLAEGVETEAQFEALVAMGCDYFQGFWLSKPLGEADYMTLLEQQIS